MTYREAVARLTGLRGGEMAGHDARASSGSRRCSRPSGNPERSFRIVQVAGTNGKGSVSAMLAAIFQAAGWRAGLYTSPHLVDIAERIRVDGRPIPEADLVDGVEAIGTLVARLDATMFEAVTALALDHFAREAVDVAVLEVGMGGRLDSTTVGTPEAEVVTHIDYDHQAYLGATLAAIAAEKAAIIRSGVAFSARQAPEAMAVLERRAREVGVPLLVEGRELAASVRGVTLDGQRLDLSGPGWRLDDVPCRLLGVFQPGHAVLAAAAARHLGADEAAIRRGLAAVRVAGPVPDRGAGADRHPGRRPQSGRRPRAGALARRVLSRPGGHARDRDLRGQGPARHPRGAGAVRRPPHPHRLFERSRRLAGRARAAPAAGRSSGRDRGLSPRGPSAGARRAAHPHNLCGGVALPDRRGARSTS